MKNELKLFNRFLKENNLFQEIKRAEKLSNYSCNMWLPLISYNSNEINGKFWSDMYIKWLIVLLSYYIDIGIDYVPNYLKDEFLRLSKFFKENDYEKYVYDNTYFSFLKIVYIIND